MSSPNAPWHRKTLFGLGQTSNTCPTISGWNTFETIACWFHLIVMNSVWLFVNKRHLKRYFLTRGIFVTVESFLLLVAAVLLVAEWYMACFFAVVSNLVYYSGGREYAFCTCSHLWYLEGVRRITKKVEEIWNSIANIWVKLSSPIGYILVSPIAQFSHNALTPKFLSNPHTKCFGDIEHPYRWGDHNYIFR